MIHPTAAVPMLYNRYAAPFVFLVTGIPREFQSYLIETAILTVESALGLLFVEKGIPIPHDYVTTLTNYNLRTDTEFLKVLANDRVRKSILDLLFDKPSDTSKRCRTWWQLVVLFAGISRKRTYQAQQQYPRVSDPHGPTCPNMTQYM